jgi:sigma-E factor negative regulatory protein RseC
MIEQSAKVVSRDGATIWLEAERKSTCSGCKLKQGCGTGLLDKHVGKKFSRIAVNQTDDVNVGEQVQLAIPEQALLHGAFLMYILPLVLMFAFSAFAQWANLNDVLEIFAGLSGLLFGFFIVKQRLANKEERFKAKILRNKQ